jgi:hypothetical protein
LSPYAALIDAVPNPGSLRNPLATVNFTSIGWLNVLAHCPQFGHMSAPMLTAYEIPKFPLADLLRVPATAHERLGNRRRQIPQFRPAPLRSLWRRGSSTRRRDQRLSRNPHSRCSRHAMLIVRGRVPFAPVRRCRNPLKMVRVDFHPGWDVCSRSALRRIMAIRAEAIP